MEVEAGFRSVDRKFFIPEVSHQPLTGDFAEMELIGKTHFCTFFVFC